MAYEGLVTITSSQNWTVPANIFKIDILLNGAGGKGGDHNAALESDGAGGGAGGAQWVAGVSVQPNDVFECSIVDGSASISTTGKSMYAGRGDDASLQNPGDGGTHNQSGFGGSGENGLPGNSGGDGAGGAGGGCTAVSGEGGSGGTATAAPGNGSLGAGGGGCAFNGPGSGIGQG